MRLVLGLVLLVRTGSHLWSHLDMQTTLNSVLLTGSGLLLIAGLWTPLTGTVVAVIEISQIRAQGGLDAYARPTHGLSTDQIRARILETTD